MRAFRFSLIVLGLVLFGCGQEKAPTSPDGQVHAMLSAQDSRSLLTPMAQGKLSDLWPNDDGHAWSFQYRSEENFDQPVQYYETPEEVPAAPSPEDVLSALRTAVVLPDAQLGLYGLRFDGQKTTLSGATGQNLVESLIEPGTGLGDVALTSFDRRILNRVGWARPDLRGKIAALGVSTRRLDTLPILLHGGAWEKTLDHIGTYGDLDRALAWKFLGADTKQGATFRMQLVPSLTTDVFLDAWVVPNRMQVGSSRGKSVEVVYVIDYGVSQVTDQTGAVIGFYRPLGYGSVTYVPGQGPVSMLERAIVPLEHPEQPLVQITLTTGGPTAIAIH